MIHKYKYEKVFPLKDNFSFRIDSEKYLLIDFQKYLIHYFCQK